MQRLAAVILALACTTPELLSGVAPTFRSAVASAQAQTGTIVGTVKLTRSRGTPLATPMYPTRAVGKQSASATPEIRNVVVYLKGVPFRGVLPTSRVQLVQRDEMFVPRVVAITRGSTIDFPNQDPFFHNVFSLSGAATFDLGRYPQGQTRTKPFAKAGLVKVFCHIHSHMAAAILVLDHPYFVIPETDGTFELRGIPAGDHALVGWHERIGEKAAMVHVDAGRSTTVSISLPVEDAP